MNSGHTDLNLVIAGIRDTRIGLKSFQIAQNEGKFRGHLVIYLAFLGAEPKVHRRGGPGRRLISWSSGAPPFRLARSRAVERNVDVRGSACKVAGHQLAY